MKRTRWQQWSAVWLLALASHAPAQVNLELDTELAMAYGAQGNNMDQADLLLRPEISMTMGADAEAVLSARLRWATVDDLLGDPRALETYSNFSKPWQERELGIDLRDAYIELSFGNGRARIGKQQIVWGALDGLKLLDAINPQDFREFILDDFDESRISQWAVHLEWPLGGGHLELAAVPDTSVHELPGPGAKFAFTAQRFRFGLPASRTAAAATVQQDIKRNNRPLQDGTYALRFSRFTAGWDLAASVVTGTDHSPVGAFKQGANGRLRLQRQYRSRTIAGLAAARSFGPITLRTELALRPDRAFNRRSNSASILEVVRRDQWSAALAMDWQAPLDLFVNVQILHEQIHNHDQQFAAPATDTLATTFVRRNFRYDTISAQLRWYGNLADGDGLVRPSLGYQIDDNTHLEIGADLFYGQAQGIFGQFASADQITLTLRRVF